MNLGFEFFDELDDGQGGMGAIFDFGDVLAGNAETLGELGTTDSHLFAQGGDAECEGVFGADDGGREGHGGWCGYW